MCVYRGVSFRQGTAVRVPCIIDGKIVWWSVYTAIYLLILCFSGTVNCHWKGNGDNFSYDCTYLTDLVVYILWTSERAVRKISCSVFWVASCQISSHRTIWGVLFCLISFWGMKPCSFVGFRRYLLPASPHLTRRLLSGGYSWRSINPQQDHCASWVKILHLTCRYC